MSTQRDNLKDVLSIGLIRVADDDPEAVEGWKLTTLEKDYDGYWKLWNQCISHKKETKQGFVLFNAKMGEKWLVAGAG